MTYVYIAIGILFVVLITAMCYAIKHEEEVLEKAEKKNTNEVHDSHPIGSYFKLCKENDDVCNTASNFHNHDIQFNGSELTIGGVIMAAFFIGLLFVIL